MNFDKLPAALLIGLIIGIPLGLYVALVSYRHEKIKGGMPALIFHAIGAIFICTAFPGVIVAAFRGAGIIATIAFGFSLFGVAFLALCGYAVFERPSIEAASKLEDQGWTAEKAKTSGL